MSKPLIAAGRSPHDGRVKVSVDLSTWGWNSPSIKVQASAHIDVLDARLLANDLIAIADAAEAKIAKKAASDERHRKWREREIAAGRTKALA